MSEPTPASGLHHRSRIAVACLAFALAWMALVLGGQRAYAQEATATTDPAATADSGLTQSKADIQIQSNGSGDANTGGNRVRGNESDNTSEAEQAAEAPEGSDAGVLNNSADTRNTSNGSASVETGNAKSVGSTSTNIAAQGAAVGGDLAFVDQDIIITNDGDADANTGDNDATGNESENDADTDQELEADSGAVLSNNADTANSSDGTAGVTTGDADATGNESHNSVNQWATTANASGSGGIVDIDQEAAVLNDGDADADTGGNEAVGNESDNDSETEQSATSIRGPPEGDTLASNFADTLNSSDGTADINTGDAKAKGNRSDTSITQEAIGKGSLSFTDQTADIENDGDAAASTGDNEATGNESDNDATTDQEAGIFGDTINVDAFTAVAFADTTNESDGSASITTGDACACGNEAHNSVSQHADPPSDDGIAFVDQEIDVDNDGDSSASTGDNEATGNDSENEATTNQVTGLFAEGGDGGTVSQNTAFAVVVVGDPAPVIAPIVTATATANGGNATINADDVVFNSFADTRNFSDGTASITTGRAQAVGNRATTEIDQTADYAFDDDGLVDVEQEAEVDNDGDAEASTGDNEATGNDSENESTTNQVTGLFAAGGDGGTATANATLVSTVVNTVNVVGGAATINTTIVPILTATATANGGNATINVDDVTANGFADTINESDGTASIATGSASAWGNVSETHINGGQSADTAIGGDGNVFVDQVANVDNDGDAGASTGGNEATGNDSDNDATTNQVNGVFAEAGDGGTATATVVENDVIVNTITTVFGNVNVSTLVAPILVATATANGGDATVNADDVNTNGFADTRNSSDGSADISTGAATAVGNTSTTGIAQDASTAIDGDGNVFVDQEVGVDNDGDAEASTGDNEATGNESDNEATTNQVNGLFADAGDGGTASATATEVLTIVRTINATFGDVTVTDTIVPLIFAGPATANGGSAALNADDVLSNNFADTINESDGTASIATGSAAAWGNVSDTQVNGGQSADSAIGGDGNVFVDQDVDVDNDGDADASTGDNEATGNESDNDSTTEQVNGVFAGAGDGGTATAAATFVFVEVDTITLVFQGVTGVTINSLVAPILIAAPVDANGGNATATVGDLTTNGFADTSNSSDGEASIDTGAASAVGNSSTTGIEQSDASAIDGDGNVFVDQNAEVENDGDAEASTGDNEATGNDSENEAVTEQVNGLFATGGDGGTASASATLVETIIQTISTTFGDVTITITDVPLVFAGPSTANGGAGTATADELLANSFADTSNSSDGAASIATGSATAWGNVSETHINGGQSADVTIGGDGNSFVDQDADVENDGDADASTGGNEATGNDSDNDATTEQLSGVFGTGGAGGTASATTVVNEVIINTITTVFGNVTVSILNAPIASSTATANGAAGSATAGDVTTTGFADTSNSSDGSASIDTGAATAVGNFSTTGIAQSDTTAIDGDGLSFIDQDADIDNEGDADASTGDNEATGNDSDNEAETTQTQGLFGDGGAGGTANASVTFVLTIVETVNVVGGAATINVTVVPILSATATANGAAGSATADDILAIGNADTSNSSDGSADIATGDASSTGNAANNQIDQDAVVDIIDDGISDIDQEAEVENDGDADASTGDNEATGNESDNDADSDQEALLIGEGGDGGTATGAASLVVVVVGDPAPVIASIITVTETDDGEAGTVSVDDASVVNFSDTTNSSDGSASVDSGHADATGNWSATNVEQAVVDPAVLEIIDQAIEIVNEGDADANSGDNEAEGNESENESENEQLFDLVGDNVDSDEVLLSNFGDATNESDGGSDIATGNAAAKGNVAVNSACSGVNTDVECEEVALPALPIAPPLPPLPEPCEDEDKPDVPVKPVPEQPTAEVGETLPVTGGPLAAQAAFGLLLVALGSVLRRRGRAAQQ